MVEAETPSTAPNDNRRLMRRSAIYGCVLVLILLALAVAWLACPWFLRMRAGGTPQDIAQMQQRLSLVEKQVQTLEGQLANLGAQAGKNAEPVAGQEMPASSAAALAHMQSDVAALSSAVSGFQAELKKAGNAAAHTQQAAQSSLAAAIAFIQLRESAETGSGFASELAALRSAVKGDGGFQEPIEKLEPYAAKGVPTIEALRAEFIAMESPATVEIAKSAAQNWRERLLAELKGLVSIRPLHGGGASDAFTATEDALASGDLPAALAASSNLPAGAEETLKDWRVKAEARETVETALRALSDHFIAQAAPVSPNTQDEP